MLHSTLSRVRDYLTPASNVSNFAETGQISPEEFVTAGDYLVNKFPTWSWVPVTDPKKRTNDLPADKQYLVLRHAPCHSRLDEGFSSWNPDEEEDDEAGEPKGVSSAAASGAAPAAAPQAEVAEDSDDEIPDMDDEDDEDDDAVVRKPSGGASKTPFRYYNLYLTYSNYYRVPRSYLSGYDGATKAPLPNPTDIFSDISADYREKTVTIEPFPFPTSDSPIQVQMASVHPCRHAETMKRIFEIMEKRKERKLKELEGKDDTTEEGEGWEEVHAATAEAAEGEAEGDELRVDQYMVVFVKFLAGVMPGVEMDYTMGM